MGATLFILVGVVIASLIVYDGANFGPVITTLLTAVPVLVGLVFLVGRPQPKRLAYGISLGLPILIIIGFGVEPVYRVSTRFDDGDRTARLIEGNGVTLLWAPAGPGWTREGLVSWDEAVHRARHLSEDGTAIADKPQDIRRLPTREEIVRSMTRRGQNAGGQWDAQTQRPSYERRPDKESPLWDSPPRHPHAPGDDRPCDDGRKTAATRPLARQTRAGKLDGRQQRGGGTHDPFGRRHSAVRLS
jgi:hypothetical protein